MIPDLRCKKFIFGSLMQGNIMFSEIAKKKIPVTQYTDLMPFSPKQRINFFLKIKRGQPLDYPRQFWIESTSECNLRCVMCPQSIGLKRKSEMMNMDTFMIIIDQIYIVKPRIMLHMGGEPLLSKSLLAMIGYAKKRGCWVGFHTNATLLTKEMSMRILKSPLDYIHFSFDGSTSDVYEQIRRGANFDKVKSQIEDFLELRRENKINHPLTSIQILEMMETKKQICDFINHWKKKGVDRVTSKLSGNWNGLVDERYMEKVMTFGYRPCRDIFHKCTILADGTVVPCCQDIEGRLPLGNILKQNFNEIWNGELYNNLRRQHIRNTVPAAMICNQCISRRSWSRSEQISQWFLKLFLWKKLI